jgi:hypothetical protein
MHLASLELSPCTIYFQAGMILTGEKFWPPIPGRLAH